VRSERLLPSQCNKDILFLVGSALDLRGEVRVGALGVLG
jgi:hypothetical protein